MGERVARVDGQLTWGGGQGEQVRWAGPAGGLVRQLGRAHGLGGRVEDMGIQESSGMSRGQVLQPWRAAGYANCPSQPNSHHIFILQVWFPKLALANGVLTVLVRRPCRVVGFRRGNRRSDIIVNMHTNAAVPQKPYVK